MEDDARSRPNIAAAYRAGAGVWLACALSVFYVLLTRLGRLITAAMKRVIRSWKLGELRQASERIMRRAGFPLAAAVTTLNPVVLPTTVLAVGYDLPVLPIDVDVDDHTLVALFERTRQQWLDLGETEPFYSVLTGDEHRLANMTLEAKSAFYASGAANADLLTPFEQRAGTTLPLGVCFELGCGVGRVTRFLADRFEKVIAADISPGNLVMCERYLEENKIQNVETRLISDVRQLNEVEGFDILYSIIALQHNSPPVQNYILHALLNKINPGGASLFQTCTNLQGYSFAPEAYLNHSPVEMEVHSLPQRYIMAAIREAGLDLQEVLMDNWVSAYGSNTFFATKPALG